MIDLKSIREALDEAETALSARYSDELADCDRAMMVQVIDKVKAARLSLDAIEQPSTDRVVDIELGAMELCENANPPFSNSWIEKPETSKEMYRGIARKLAETWELKWKS